MKDILLEETHKENISKYKYSVIDNSLSSYVFKPFWIRLQKLFPSYVAPNVISLVGLLVTIYSWNLCENHFVGNDSSLNTPEIGSITFSK